jgi:hypothetical protein
MGAPGIPPKTRDMPETRREVPIVVGRWGIVALPHPLVKTIAGTAAELDAQPRRRC